MEYQKLNSTHLKLIALITMTIDHIGAVIFTETEIFRIIGRIAFPIFAFLLTEGIFYTKNKWKYLSRLLIFALISEIPFNLALKDHSIFYSDHQNVFFSLAIGLLMMIILEEIKKKELHYILDYALSLLILIIACIIAYMLKTDYNVFAPMIIFSLYNFKDYPFLRFSITAAILICMGGTEPWAVLSIPMMLCYNGSTGALKRKWMRMMVYWYYPSHLLILVIIAKLTRLF